MTSFEQYLPKFILVFVIIAILGVVLLVKGCADEINERGIKSIVMELWEGPSKNDYP